MTFDPNKIPIWLRRTTEQQAQDDALQDRLRQAMGPGVRPSRMERQLLQAAAIRRSAEAHLHHLRETETPAPEHVHQAEAQLAEALAMQGNFAQAAELHPSPEHAARLQKIADAIERPDDEAICNCALEHKHDSQRKQSLVIQNENATELVFSPKHNRLVPVIECRKCGGMNVRPATASIDNRMHQVHATHQQAKRDKAAGRNAT